MLRRQIYLTEMEIKALKIYSKEMGISTSEYIRRVIDDHIEKTSGKKMGELKNFKGV